ncbi:meprin A subunit beta-like isoform X1 [Poecilia reticulata]|uniref:meprin A subunit beta-like isoform X1 n=1 Tax=Poecilia reticulata TaxID=8081 RepID=UPI0004A4F434|nr:PREDICTED: meprin A subunit beta-like isoform X1 [Poecilia reticulata]
MLRLTKKMQDSIFLVVCLVVSSTLAESTQKSDINDIGMDRNTTNDLLVDDTLQKPNTGRSTILGGNALWKSPVPYVLDKSLDLNTKGVILRAFDQFRVKSCIDFKPRDTEEYYLSFKNLAGCWSYVGRVDPNGQNVSISADCGYIGEVEHMILHALGFHHEELRYDRDDYVQIDFDNVLAGKENDFSKVGKNLSSTHDVPYDYLSVMHSGKNALTNGNGSTIITKDPKFQDVIGQRMEMSSHDAEELNLLYKCNSTIASMFFCDFSNGMMCQMSEISSCAQSDKKWEVVTQVSRGPSSDHTSLPAGNKDNGQETGYFIHASTASGQKGDSAWLETQIMTTKRECKVQCLQFYYFHSGNELDELNIWIREFQDEHDTKGTLRLMGQITGQPTYHWQIHHVSLNAAKNFQVVFEVRKGAGNSDGGFSVDDINLSETECPHVTLQIDDFEKLLSSSDFGTRIYSPRHYSKEGYAYRIGAILYQSFVGLYVQLLSGDYNAQLEWPCLRRQMTLQLLDQTPNMQKKMSKQISFVTEQTHMTSGINWWDNPLKTYRTDFFENGELVYGGFLVGYPFLASLEELQTREFLKGGSAIFMFNFEDLTPLVNGSSLSCPQVRPMNNTNRSTNLGGGPCFLTGIPGFSPGLAASPVLSLLLAMISMQT